MRSTPRRLPTLLLATVALLAAAAPRALAAPPLDATTRDYDQIHVVVRVTPHLAEATVDGETTIRYASLVDPLRVLRLHCQETAVMSVRDGDGTPCEFAVADNVLAVTLAKPTPRGAQAEVTVVYRSRPTAGLYFHTSSTTCPDTPDEMYSQGEGTDNRRWFPCYDEPDDRATCEIFVTRGDGFTSVANGTLVETLPAAGGAKTDHWKLDQRIPTYLISLIVGRYATVHDAWEGVPLDYNGPVGREDEIRQGFSATKDILAFFSAYTGRKYPYPRYAQTTVWDFVYGGMENAGATTMNMRLLHPPEARPNYSSDGLVAHEAAHQWFGDILTCRTWDHLWLNEGFATYFTDLFFEHRDGADQFALERFFQNRGYMDGTPHPETLGLKPDPRGDVPLELFGGKQYNRGAAILHQLRIELGDDAFQRAIRRYVKEHEDRAVVSDDLRRSCEAETGTALRWFFDQWVYGAGYPVLEASVDATSVTIEQTQPGGGGQPEAFRITVPYRLHTDRGVVEGRFDVRRRKQTFRIERTGALRLGAGGGTFARVRVRQGEAAAVTLALKEKDPTGRIEGVEALADYPSDNTANTLELVASSDGVYAVRAAAVRTLAALGLDHPARGRTLSRALTDADARVREAAVESLGTLSRDVAGPLVAKALADDRSPYVRAAAAVAAGRLHVDGAFEALRDLLKVRSHREVIQKGALEGLTALGDPRALPLAHAMLPYNSCRGDHHSMRKAALDLLTSLAPDEPETQAAIVQLLSDGFHRMRGWAAEAAGRWKVRSAEARLRAMADGDPDGGAKGAAKAALDRLAGK